MDIKKAAREDSKILTDLAIRSKSHWGYNEKQIAAWEEELTITEKYINEEQVYKLTVGNALIGFYAYKIEKQTHVKLDFLFVEPEFMGQGYGKILILNLLERVEHSEYETILVDSDPNAEGFYAKLDFLKIGELESSIKNRFLPIMELKIKHRSKVKF
ncbi:MAG: GNAT family N-acetyltransferase [Leeuwenhoekiella sp.]